MSSVHVPIPENLLSVVNHLLTLAETEPLVADHVVPALMQTIDFGMTSGKATDPDVWIRAFKAGAVYVETLKLDDQWLAMLPVNKDV